MFQIIDCRFPNMQHNVECMISYGIAGFKPINLPTKVDVCDNARKPLKPL